MERHTAAHFGVGYYGGRGLLRGRIVFPIHNARGELVAYAGRAVNDVEPRYLFPRGLHKSQVLFNYHPAVAATAQHTGRAIGVEGFFDCLKVHQAGYANVVALMGTSLSDKQWELLQRDFPETIVMLDGDEAGQRASRVLSTRGAAVCLARVPTGRPPDQLSPEEIQRIITTVPRCVAAAMNTAFSDTMRLVAAAQRKGAKNINAFGGRVSCRSSRGGDCATEEQSSRYALPPVWRSAGFPNLIFGKGRSGPIPQMDAGHSFFLKELAQSQIKKLLD